MKIKSYNLFLESVDSIKSICKKYGITNYTINSDGSIDVDGDVNLYFKGLTKLPLKFRRVTGYFDCRNNQLNSLEGSPKEVGSHFDCSRNQLTSLEGSPKEVGGNFYCRNNQLTSLEGCPNSVGGDFYCSRNQLTSLEGSPKSVGYFSCSYNQLTSLEGGPLSVGSFACSNNQLTNLIGGPEVVLGSYYASRNQITSFEGFPDDFEGEFDFTINPVQDILDQFPDNLRIKAIPLIIDYDAIWNGEIVPERIEMVKDKLGLIN